MMPVATAAMRSAMAAKRPSRPLRGIAVAPYQETRWASRRAAAARASAARLLAQRVSWYGATAIPRSGRLGRFAAMALLIAAVATGIMALSGSSYLPFDLELPWLR